MRNYFFRNVLLASMVTGLLACSSGPSRRVVWENYNVTPEMRQHRFALDSTECVALANQYFPERAGSPPPQPQSGDITLYTPSGPVFGSYQEHQQPRSQRPNPDGFMEGMMLPDQQRARRNYALACMADRGWEQREIVQGE